MRRPETAVSGGIVGFLVTFTAVVDYAAVSGDRSECDGGTCALELAAIVTWLSPLRRSSA